MVEAEDLFRQAVTRGGRQMDDILAEKADTKGVTSGAGQVSTIAGLGVLRAGLQEDNRAATAVGLVFVAGGLIIQAMAQSMTAEADTPLLGAVAPFPLSRQPAQSRIHERSGYCLQGIGDFGPSRPEPAGDWRDDEVRRGLVPGHDHPDPTLTCPHAAIKHWRKACRHKALTDAMPRA